MTLTGRSKPSVTRPGRAATATRADGAADGARSVADVETPEPSSQRSQDGGAAVTRTCTVRPCGTAVTGTKPVPWCASASGRPALVARMPVTSVPTPPRCTWASASPDDTETAGRPRSATSATPMPTITTAAPAPIPARTIQDRFFCSADGLVIVPPSRARCALLSFLSPPGRVLPSSPAPKTPRHRLPLGGGHPAAVLAERPARVRPHAASHPAGVMSLGYRTAVPASKAVPKSAPCRDRRASGAASRLGPASFEPRHGEAPASWHVVRKPAQQGGRRLESQASRDLSTLRPRLTSIPARPAPSTESLNWAATCVRVRGQ